MKVLLRSRSLAAGGLLALALAALIPATAAAKPEPGARPRGFRLFARTLGAMTVNRVYLGLSSAQGTIGSDSTGSSTIGGGFWPKGSGNQFVFNSGLQIAGKVDNPGGDWDGDVSGAFFFDARGSNQNGSSVQPVYNFLNPADAGAWPDAGRVPVEINEADNFYNPVLRGITSASQGDVWFVTWDGDPTLLGGRSHPLGVAVETRGLAWNYPTGNEDIVYFTFSFYNVTASDPAAYSGVRPALRPTMQQLGSEFVSNNNARFRINLPAGGYAIDSLFSGFGADMDVSNALTNYCSVNIPFALGFCYEHTFTFSPTTGESYSDPTIWGPPFFGGPGFVGVKYLRSPTGAGVIQLFSNTINTATGFRDPLNVAQLFRYLSGNLDTQQGDQDCNVAGGRAVGICFINPTAQDARFYQSSSALTLAPGAFGSIVVAYIFAAPVAIAGFTPGVGPGQDVTPGNPVRLTIPSALAAGANTIDSLTGFNGFTDFESPDTVTQKEFRTIPGSLLSKALTAQVIFDNGFLLPFAPSAPNFYLIPGNNQVSIVWQPSASEVQGDPFYVVASNPGTPLEPNPLYDPNYRQYDVEGYRIYRGRVDNSASLTLVQQFDYAGTEFNDFTGQVNPVGTCAPELGVTLDCPVPFDYVQLSGVPATVSTAYPLVGKFIQVKLGSASRVVVNPGQVPGDDCAAASCALVIANADTALTGSKATGGPYPELSDNGVPFGYIDREVKNNFRYFYSVTAFDVNSYQSGPTSLESPRVAKPVTPSVQGSNVVEPQLTAGLFGEGGTALKVDAPFDIDPVTGLFNGTPPATDGVSTAFAPLIPALLPAFNLTASIDSVRSLYVDNPECAGISNSFAMCYIFYVTFDKDGAKTPFVVPTPWPISTSACCGDPEGVITSQLGAQPVAIDPTAAARYGIPGTATGSAALSVTQREFIRFSSMEGQAARRNLTANNTVAQCPGSSVASCQSAASPGGSRWFSGDNESVIHPTVGIRVGHLDGVDTVWAPISHVAADPGGPPEISLNNAVTQRFAQGFAGLSREADVVLTWGANGAIASVRDITHDVPVKFNPEASATYGFVTDADGNGLIGWPDFFYIRNVCEYYINVLGGGPPGCADISEVKPLVATPTIADVTTSYDEDPGVATGKGFGLYINGEPYIFQLPGGAFPAAGTKWTLRTYSGIVRSSTATAGTLTPAGYAFSPVVRSPSVPGLKIQFTVASAATTVAATNLDLRRVHTVPDPYYVTNGYEATTESKVLQFVNLPTQAIIRIYTSSGILVNLIEHNSTDFSGAEAWNLRNRNNQVVASGVYFYMIEAGDARRVGRFTVVNFAQ